MRTRREVIQRTYERLGEIRPGGVLDGGVYQMADNTLSDMLLSLNEKSPLDFDPTADEIPEERVFPLTMMLAQLVTREHAYNHQAFLEFRKILYQGVVGPSDFVEPEVHDF